MNIGIYVDNVVDYDLIQKIKNYYDNTNNVFIFHNNIVQNHPVNNIACINSWYLDWYDSKIIFTDIDHFNKKNNSLKTKDIVLLVTKDKISNLSKETIEKCSCVLIQDKTKIRKIKNAELHKFK